ncbi:MAG: hypothetical protein P4M06_11370 [Pandoraea sp.]|nr:hypothetical protein [Pandoraea sp.]MDR3398149.1 hypothetical protein [Pandoraea sp.]
MTLAENIKALRQSATESQSAQMKDVRFLAERAREGGPDFLDKDSWGRWDSWNDWGAAS